MTPSRWRVAASVVVAFLALHLAGCGGAKEFTPEDFKKVTVGQSEDQVRDTLGRPMDELESSEKGNKAMWWNVGDKYYAVSLQNGKVLITQGPQPKAAYDMWKDMAGKVKAMAKN